MKNLAYILLAAAAALAFSPRYAPASTLYATIGATTPNGFDDVYTINQSTGAGTLLGSSGINPGWMGDLTSNNTTTLWAADVINYNLVTINPTTGAGTVVGPFVDASSGSATPITSLAYNTAASAAPGGLYGNSTPTFGGPPGGDLLYSINATTGTTTEIGPIGFSNIYALAFNNNGNLFGVDTDNQLIGINPTSGAGTLIATLTVPGIYDIAARPEDNVMFATASDNDIYTLNTTTGALTDVGPHGIGNTVGLAFLTVPEPTSLGLLATGGLSMVMLLVVRRRRA
jgi:hypothetical protein